MGASPALRAVLRAALIIGVFAGSANAADRCPQIHALMDADGDVQIPDFGRPPALCQQAIETSGPAHFCAWSFPFRDPKAAEFFADLDAQLSGCLGVGQEDAAVNHPDTYAARLYEADGARLSVSLKDKAELRQTLVFLRLGRAGG